MLGLTTANERVLFDSLHFMSVQMLNSFTVIPLNGDTVFSISTNIIQNPWMQRFFSISSCTIENTGIMEGTWMSLGNAADMAGYTVSVFGREREE